MSPRSIFLIIILFPIVTFLRSWKILEWGDHLQHKRRAEITDVLLTPKFSTLYNSTKRNCILSHPYTSVKEYMKAFTQNVSVNCSKIMENDRTEILRVKQSMSVKKKPFIANNFILKANSCFWLKNYLTNHFYNSELENSFPLAFTLVVYDSPEQVLRLIRVLYRRQNSFCIHCDAKSPYKNFFQSMAGCLDNVIFPESLTRVVWGHSSILEAQLKCMNELVKLRKKQAHKWKYLMNLCGKELPLASNRDIVQQLMKLNGTSNILTYEVTPNDTEYYSRILYPVSLINNGTQIRVDKSRRLESPPFNHFLYFYKSSGYHAFSFQFVHHLLHNKSAIIARKFFNNCKNPEEHFYASIFMMPGVPGGYDPSKKYFNMVNVFWIPPHQCAGKIVHRVCIIGVEDLPQVVKYGMGHFFHNKYFMEYDHSAMYCMEERLIAKNKKEYDADCS